VLDAHLGLLVVDLALGALDHVWQVTGALNKVLTWHIVAGRRASRRVILAVDLGALVVAVETKGLVGALAESLVGLGTVLPENVSLLALARSLA